MSNVTYASITKEVTTLRTLTGAALANDVKENLLVLTRLENLAQTALQPWVAAGIAADAIATYGRMMGQLEKLEGHHRWLEASATSPELLREATSIWESVVEQQLEVAESVGVNVKAIKEAFWEGRTHDGAVASGRANEHKAINFGHSVRSIVDGCDRARRLTENMLRTALALCAMATAGSAVAKISASSGSSMPRNWRMKHLERVIAGAATAYGNLQNSDSWSGEAEQIAKIFSEHSESLQALQKIVGGGGGGRTMMSAV